MNSFEPSRALNAIFSALADINAYLAHKEPWRMHDPAELATVLSLVIEGLRISAILLQPFIPDSAQALLSRLGIPAVEREWKNVEQSEEAIAITRLVETIKVHGPQEGVFLAMQAGKAQAPRQPV